MSNELDRAYLDSYFAEKNEIHGLSVRNWFDERLAEAFQIEVEQSYLYSTVVIAGQLTEVGLSTGEFPRYEEKDAGYAIARGLAAGVMIGGIDSFYAKGDVTEEEFEESADELIRVIEDLELSLMSTEMRESTINCVELLVQRYTPSGWDEYMSDIKYELVDDPSLHRYFTLGSSAAGYIFGSIPERRIMKKFLEIERLFNQS